MRYLEGHPQAALIRRYAHEQRGHWPPRDLQPSLRHGTPRHGVALRVPHLGEVVGKVEEDGEDGEDSEDSEEDENMAIQALAQTALRIKRKTAALREAVGNAEQLVAQAKRAMAAIAE